MNNNNLFYFPLYERNNPVAVYASQLQRYAGVNKKDVSLFSLFLLKAKSFILCPFQKIAREHFDYLICGCDCISSLMIASNLSKKGYRTLIYQSSPVQDGAFLNTVIQVQSEIFGNELYNWFNVEFPGNNFKTIQEITKFFSDSCAAKDANDNPLVLMTNGSQYSVNDHWSSIHENFCELIEINKPKEFFVGLWDIPNYYLVKLHQPKHINNAPMNAEDTCLITFKDMIMTTRSSYSINSEIKTNSVHKFGEALCNINNRDFFNLTDRVKDLQKINNWLKTIKTKVNHER